MSARSRKRSLDQSPEREGKTFTQLIISLIKTEGRRPYKRFRGNFRDGGQEQEPSDETKLEMLIEKVGEKVLEYKHMS